MGATMGKNTSLLDALPTGQGTLHIVMLGLDSAGKTTALYRLKFDQYLNTVPTIGFNCEKVKGTVGRSKGINFLVWDVGGQEKLRPLWKSYTRCTDGIVFVVDSVDLERMEEAKMELLKTAKSPDNTGVPILVLANKQDLPGARDSKELEKLLGLHEISSGGGGGSGNHLWHIQAACAITGEGLQEGLDSLYGMIVKRKKLSKQNKRWFSVMTERGQVKARQYTTVQRLIAAQVTAFLIIGPDLIGYYQNNQKIAADGARSRYQYIKTVVRSGQILKLLAVYEDIAEQSTRSKRLSWPLLGSKQQSTQYAQCMTIKKQIVYIPITTHGYFYAVSTANNTAEDNVSKVYQIAKLLQVFPLPVRVCSIYPQKINGSILLETYHKEDVMLACVLDEKPLSGCGKTRFLEIDINSKFFVNLVVDEQRLFKKARVQRALRNCHADSEKWCQQLKVIHHIYPNPGKNPLDSSPTATSSSNGQPEKPKRTRKLSLGDKKTVKSASFRYSTSYGLDDVRPPYRPLPPNEVYHSKSASHIPPVYLNIACKPANEENCSSLPTQKADRTQFENEILQSVLRNEQLSREKGDDHQRASAKERVTVSPRKCVPLADCSSYHGRANNEKKTTTTTTTTTSQTTVTKNNALEHSNSNHNLHNRQQQHQSRVTSGGGINARTTSFFNGINDTTSKSTEASKLSDLRYRVIKKENTYIERDFSKMARQPVYKTQVVVKIDDSYSHAVDAIRSNSSHHSSKDNIYAEINEYPELMSKSYAAVFPQKTSCFVGDSCTTSYIRVPSTTTVNVS